MPNGISLPKAVAPVMGFVWWENNIHEVVSVLLHERLTSVRMNWKSGSSLPLSIAETVSILACLGRPSLCPYCSWNHTADFMATHAQ
jgi:hypothetical protein